MIDTDIDAAWERAEAELRQWLDQRTPETMRPWRDLMERADLCAPPELSPKDTQDALLLDQDRREILLDLLAERATALQGDLEDIAEDEEEFPEDVEEEHKTDVRAWRDGTVALHDSLKRMFGRG